MALGSRYIVCIYNLIIRCFSMSITVVDVVVAIAVVAVVVVVGVEIKFQ